MSQIEFKIASRQDEKMARYLALRFGQILTGAKEKEVIYQEEQGRYLLGGSNDFWLRLYPLPTEEGCSGYRIVLSCRYAPESFLLAAKTIITYRYEEIKAAAA